MDTSRSAAPAPRPRAPAWQRMVFQAPPRPGPTLFAIVGSQPCPAGPANTRPRGRASEPDGGVHREVSKNGLTSTGSTCQLPHNAVRERSIRADSTGRRRPVLGRYLKIETVANELVPARAIRETPQLLEPSGPRGHSEWPSTMPLIRPLPQCFGLTAAGKRCLLTGLARSWPVAVPR